MNITSFPARHSNPGKSFLFFSLFATLPPPPPPGGLNYTYVPGKNSNLILILVPLFPIRPNFSSTPGVAFQQYFSQFMQLFGAKWGRTEAVLNCDNKHPWIEPLLVYFSSWHFPLHRTNSSQFAQPFLLTRTSWWQQTNAVTRTEGADSKLCNHAVSFRSTNVLSSTSCSRLSKHWRSDQAAVSTVQGLNPGGDKNVF